MVVTEPDRPLPLILDVDTGLDDALALALAVASPRADLVAVTTLAGNVEVGAATRNTLAVLDWLGAADVPVHRGASQPLARTLHDATYFHGDDGLGGADLPPSARAIGPDRGPAAIIRLATARHGKLTLVCLGPLTNLAIALNVEPDLPDRLAGLVVMGGAYWVPGNVTPQAEFNIHADPEAAAQVFAAAPRFRHVTAIGLDVSMQTSLRPADWQATADADTPAARLVHRLCRHTFETQARPEFHLHDPLALAVALDPSLVDVELVDVAVDLDAAARGRTRPNGTGSVRVARSVETARFLRSFKTVLGLPEAAAR